MIPSRKHRHQELFLKLGFDLFNLFILEEKQCLFETVKLLTFFYTKQLDSDVKLNLLHVK